MTIMEKKKRIIIVEDDAVLRDVLAVHLLHDGFCEEVFVLLVFQRRYPVGHV